MGTRPGSHRRNPRREKAGTRTSSWLNFTPLSLSPAFWFDASDTATITESGGAVSQWNDKSGNARHVTQANASLQPSTGTTTQNNLNVINFSTNDYLGPSSTGFNPSTNGLTVFFAVRQTPAIARQAIAIAQKDSSGTGRTWLSYFPNTTSFANALGANIQTLPNTTNPCVVTLRSAPGSSQPKQMFRDGYLESAVANVTIESSVGGINVGADKFQGNTWEGWIGEIIVVGAAMTFPDIDVVENYLINKWGIVI